MSGIYIVLFPKESKGFYPHFSGNAVKSAHRLWMPPDAAEGGAKAQKGEWSHISPLLKGETWNSIWLVLDHHLASASGVWNQPRELKCSGE